LFKESRYEYRNFDRTSRKAGWRDLASGEFLGVEFDQIGKAKVARNNWFVMLKSTPLLDGIELDAWNDNYEYFSKRTQAGMFTSGKYFVLILLVDTVAADAVERFAQGAELGFLGTPEEITHGGGYTLMVIKDRKQILMPKKIVLWDLLRATEFAKQTHQAVVGYTNTL